MNLAIIVGNIGADARVEEANGHKFVTFNVAHNERWTGEDGVQHERIEWISCAWNGDGGKLLQFLKKGRSVLIIGRTSVRCYSSPKERRMVAGQNCAVDRIELIGGAPDIVPSRLYTKDGAELPVYRFFGISQEAAAQLTEGAESAQLVSRSGEAFSVDKNGWVLPTNQE